MSDAPRHLADAAPEVIRSEERVRAGVERVPVARAVLRKRVVVEQRTITVEVRHEEVVLETVHDALPDAAPEPLADDALPEFVLHEEEVVVTKRVVPTERVRLRIDRVVEQQQVSADVRHEVVDLDRDPLR